jgi:hypothetical protein
VIPSLQFGNPAKSSPAQNAVAQFLDLNVKKERYWQSFYIELMRAGGELRTNSNLKNNERLLWV